MSAPNPVTSESDTVLLQHELVTAEPIVDKLQTARADDGPSTNVNGVYPTKTLVAPNAVTLPSSEPRRVSQVAKNFIAWFRSPGALALGVNSVQNGTSEPNIEPNPLLASLRN